MVLGRIFHYAFDAVLISTILAGMKRSTGLTPSFQTDTLTDNKDIKKWFDSYLSIGELVMDNTVAMAGNSKWFKRVR